jgi:hypothetical protein
MCSDIQRIYNPGHCSQISTAHISINNGKKKSHNQQNRLFGEDLKQLPGESHRAGAAAQLPSSPNPIQKFTWTGSFDFELLRWSKFFNLII